MKKISTLKRITTSILLVALMTTSAFAATASSETLIPAPEETSNILVSGTVSSVEVNEDYNTIEITNDNMGMIFHVNKTVFVIDQKTNKLVSLDDIVKDMEIAVILDKMAPMTLSIPGQTSGAIGIVVLDSEGSINLSIYDGNLVNLDNTLALNIHTTTNIAHEKGLKMIFGVDDLKGKECLVLYSFATFSIPAQTTPDFVMILNGSETDEAANAAYVPLRALAEEKGYKVIWQSHTKPIVLEKNDIKVELIIGEKSFEFTHMTKDIKPLDRISELDLVVKLENGTTMVADSFIEAL